jgi:uncharacterized cupredoxin-like copper-binding protein
MSRSSLSARWTSLGTLATAVLVAAGGCAKKEAAPTAQAGPNHVIVTASDYAFTAPDSISAGLEMFHLVNKGPSVHHVQIVELLEGKTVSDLMNAMKNPWPPPAFAKFVGGPNAVAPSGVDTAFAYVTLEAGNYALICLIPDSAGTPHFAKGMMRSLTVTASAATPAAEPTSDVVIHLKDYDFVVTGNLTAGTHNVQIVNDGPQMHEMLIGMLAPGKTPQDFLKWTGAGMRGMPPLKPLGGATTLMPGGHETITLNLVAGNYGLFCFVPDAKDGKGHVMHGMVKQLTVRTGGAG